MQCLTNLTAICARFCHRYESLQLFKKGVNALIINSYYIKIRRDSHDFDYSRKTLKVGKKSFFYETVFSLSFLAI